MGNSYTLGEPMWKIAQREKPLRDIAVAERIKELQDQRELIQYELEVLRPSQAPPTSQSINPSVAGSLSGFHNPRKHHGVTIQEFFILWRTNTAKRKDAKHTAMLLWVEKHEQETLSYIRHTFTRTIKEG